MLVDLGVSADIGSLTSQESILRTYLLPTNLDDPKGDAYLRIDQGDYRLLGVAGFTIEFPTIDKVEDDQIICELGTRVIDGTSDVFESLKTADLMARYREYARVYNQTLVGHYDANLR